MVVDHAKIMAQMPEKPLGEEERVNLDSPKPDVSLELGEDRTPSGIMGYQRK